MSSAESPDRRHEMPEDPTQDPEEALDTVEERVFGSTADQERDDDAEHGADDGDASTSTPVADEPPA
ncbi:hypothetical protein [Pseudonocardia sp. KRD291]|uniref:hypothetical protein n=1 Tax=Pseudonocardia sp. KRD291 TaxID=2792007 RepID=UPI001C49E1B2|nr:hypothetical protein [Pseudonocardia sp. KRD291]MBW0102553.1 hypothetical protein [Pseudonocardia sp. KRD291]